MLCGVKIVRNLLNFVMVKKKKAHLLKTTTTTTKKKEKKKPKICMFLLPETGKNKFFLLRSVII